MNYEKFLGKEVRCYKRRKTTFFKKDLFSPLEKFGNFKTKKLEFLTFLNEGI